MRFYQIVLLVTVCASFFPSMATAQATDVPPVMSKPYSAELALLGNSSSIPTMMKFFVDGPKTRIEITEDGNLTVEIVREDQQKIYIPVPGGKTKEIPLTDKTRDALVYVAHLAEGKFEDLGHEATGPSPRAIYKVTLTNGSNFCLWIDSYTHLPVKLADSRNTFIYLKFEYGDQSPALFEPPDDTK
jgi:hypothetical protein